MRSSHLCYFVVLFGLFAGCGGTAISGYKDGGADGGRDTVDGPPSQGDVSSSDATLQQGSTPLGQACSNASECQSGFCADGVCCQTACTGPCQSCAIADSAGTCLPVKANTVDPRGQCTDEGLSSCGHNGKCDGDGACAYYAAGTIWRPARCSGSTKTNAATCDGAGRQVNGLSVSCGAFTCDVTSNDCRNTCSVATQATDCTAGNFCVNSSCGPKPPGASCGAGTECDSGICQQGVCCTTACSGTCMSCAVQGSTGTCTPVPDGLDPLGQCDDQGSASCGNDGFCDGAGSCRSYAASTVCGASSCSIDGKTLEWTCNGSGTCQKGAFQSCSPYVCASSTDCATSCSSDAQCAAPFTCQSGKCARKSNGIACSSASECISNLCEGGTCCGTPCPAPCKSCSTGTCTNFAADSDPNKECGVEATACGLTGLCDGKGACAFQGAGTACGQTCSGSSLTLARCDGKGDCVNQAPTSCSPYMCSSSGTVCLLSCTDNSACLAPDTCNLGKNACGDNRPNGASCSGAADCNSGFCVEGVCCNSSCGGTCRSCKIAGAEGTCSPIPAGTAAPSGQCPDNGADLCGTNGKCDGLGACQLYATGTLCGSTSCDNGIQTAAPRCDGAGTCTPGATKKCDPYICGATACATSCATMADCAPTYSCVNNKCQLLGTGTACTADAQCATGICAQGYCCSTDCGGCSSCGLAGNQGTCKALANGATPNPASTCAVSAASGCKTDGKCDGNGGCRNYPAGTTCEPAVCSGSALTPPKACDGNGECKNGGSARPCDPYKCSADGTACLASCSSNGDCIDTASCNAGNTCGLLPNGASCASGTACNSGFCVDGVCCNSACTGTCASCKVAGDVGACTSIAAGDDPDGECTQAAKSTCGLDGTCNGSGACRYWADGTQCSAATCSDQHTLVSTGGCDGAAHSCKAGASTNCAPYACDATAAACKASCTGDADCATGFTCKTGTCSASAISPGSTPASQAGPNNAQTATTTTFSHTLDWGSNTNRIVLVGINGRINGGQPTAVTYNGVAMTKLASAAPSGGDPTALVYYLLDAQLPAAAGSYSVAITVAAQSFATIYSANSFANVGQAAPAFLTQSGDQGVRTQSFANPPQGAVLTDTVGFVQGSASAASGQTVLNNPATSAYVVNGYHLGASYKVCNTDNPCNLGWTFSATSKYAWIAIQLTP